MDKERKHSHPQKQSEQKVQSGQLTNLDSRISFTDKERKREEINHSTIGGF